MRRPLLALLLALALPACGSRGDPLPPINKMPPPFPGAVIYQRGTDLVLQFEVLPAVVNVNGAMVPLANVEILTQSELYPALTADLLAVALDQERRTRLRDARAAAAMSREEIQRLRDEAAVAERAAAAVTEAAEADETETDDEDLPARTADEFALRTVPRAVLAEWRAAGISPDAILSTAYLLQEAVDLLWEELDMPAAIVDLREPPELPDPGEIITAAGRVERTMAYPFAPDVFEFLRDADSLLAVSFDDLDDYRVGDRFEFRHQVPPPQPGNIRTRYAFAVRAISESGEDGAVGELLAIAPAAVPMPPSELVTEILAEEGVELSWEAPVADVRGEPIDPENVRYNIYRRDLPASTTSLTPLNAAPLSRTTYIDTTIGWQERYVYEVHAVSATAEDRAAEEEEEDDAAVPVPVPVDPTAGAAPDRPESASLTSNEIFTEDTFAPAAVLRLAAVRTGSRVTLRWSASAVTDLAGYRVYRHPAPAPTTPDLMLDGKPQVPEAETGVTDDEIATMTEPEAPETEAEGITGEEIVGEEAEGAAAEEVVGEEAEGAAVQELAGQEREGALATRADDPQDEPMTPRRRRQLRARNPLVEAGWELLTFVVVTQIRYIDPVADPATTWVYLVEVVDEADNVSIPVAVTLEAEEVR